MNRSKISSSMLWAGTTKKEKPRIKSSFLFGPFGMLCANVIRAMSIIAIDFVVGAITLVHLADCGYMEAKSYVRG